MSEYRHTSGAIKTESQIRADNPNTSFPRGVLPAGILSDLGYTGILPTPQPNPSASTKIVVRDGIEQDSDKNWVQKWIEKDRFSDIEGGKTKDQQDAEYQTELDNRQKDILRGTREPLLAEADWQIHAYGSTSHAFTNKEANSPEMGMAYNPDADRRSWKSMTDFLKEVIG